MNSQDQSLPEGQAKTTDTTSGSIDAADIPSRIRAKGIHNSSTSPNGQAEPEPNSFVAKVPVKNTKGKPVDEPAATSEVVTERPVLPELKTATPKRRGRPPKKMPEESRDIDLNTSGQDDGKGPQQPASLALPVLEPSPPSGILTEAESRELEACESVVSSFKVAFLAAGKALQKINSERLYREQYQTFEAYTQKRWGLGHSHAHRLMDSVRVMNVLSPIGETDDIPLPDCEAQVRPLTRLNDDQIPTVWVEVVKQADNDPISAALVSRVAKGFRCPSEPEPPKEVIDVEAQEATPMPGSSRAVTGLRTALFMLRDVEKDGVPSRHEPELKRIEAALAAFIDSVAGQHDPHLGNSPTTAGQLPPPPPEESEEAA